MPCHKRQCKLLPENSTENPPCMIGIKPDVVWKTLNSKMVYPQKSSDSINENLTQ